MTLREAVTSVFSNYTNFSGRARRSEYWYFTLFNVIVSMILKCIDETYYRFCHVQSFQDY